MNAFREEKKKNTFNATILNEKAYYKKIKNPLIIHNIMSLFTLQYHYTHVKLFEFSCCNIRSLYVVN